MVGTYILLHILWMHSEADFVQSYLKRVCADIKCHVQSEQASYSEFCGCILRLILYCHS